MDKSAQQDILIGLPSDHAKRKAIPLCTGVLDYFCAALVGVALVSRLGNDQHNPGQPLHWDRGRSTDHADALLRHLARRGLMSPEGLPEEFYVAWRALALAQEAAERVAGFKPTDHGEARSSQQPYSKEDLRLIKEWENSLPKSSCKAVKLV